MSTRNIPDDELDEFFKKSAENYPVEISPGAWQQMEQKLDQAYRRTLLLRTSLAVLVAVGLVLLLFLTVGNEGPMTGEQPHESATGMTTTSPDQPDLNPAPGPGPIGQIESVPSPRSQFQSSTSTSTSSSASPSLFPPQPDPNLLLSDPGSAPGPGAQPIAKPVLARISDPGGEKSALPAASNSEKGKSKLSTGEAEVANVPALAGADQKNTPSAVSAQLPAPADSAVLDTDNQAARKNFGKAERQRFRFGLQVVVGPDLSSVGFPRLGQPGSNVGLLLEYHLSPRISLSGGVLHGTKVYKAGPYDYTPTRKIWTYGVKPDRIDAVCEVIDIPLNFRFTAFRKGRTGLFATTGISTFLMRDERYAYIYDNPNPHLIGSWRVKNGSRHPFSVYNLSVGYERGLSERFSLQAEPFVKVPLGGVGFGHVKLTSVGLFFSARYHFSPR
jgi:cytoskeletal protein RodZ